MGAEVRAEEREKERKNGLKLRKWVFEVLRFDHHPFFWIFLWHWKPFALHVSHTHFVRLDPRDWKQNHFRQNSDSFFQERFTAFLRFSLLASFSFSSFPSPFLSLSSFTSFSIPTIFPTYVSGEKMEKIVNESFFMTVDSMVSWRVCDTFLLDCTYFLVESITDILCASFPSSFLSLSPVSLSPSSALQLFQISCHCCISYSKITAVTFLATHWCKTKISSFCILFFSSSHFSLSSSLLSSPSKCDFRETKRMEGKRRNEPVWLLQYRNSETGEWYKKCKNQKSVDERQRFHDKEKERKKEKVGEKFVARKPKKDALFASRRNVSQNSVRYSMPNPLMLDFPCFQLVIYFLLFLLLLLFFSFRFFNYKTSFFLRLYLFVPFLRSPLAKSWSEERGREKSSLHFFFLFSFFATWFQF